MSGTLTVKELINELLEYPMEDLVFVGLGDSGSPIEQAEILMLNTAAHAKSKVCIVARENLMVQP
jgi:hypothetical protein